MKNYADRYRESYAPRMSKEQAERIKRNLARIRAAFRPTHLKRVCEMDEREFAAFYMGANYEVEQPAPDNFFAFIPNRAPGQGDTRIPSKIVGVAHLDTVVFPDERLTSVGKSAAGWVCHSGALDDRLGAYILLELLPRLGIHLDVVLATGEESGQSTAGFAVKPHDYNWLIEFDRGDMDVVSYEYDCLTLRDMVADCGARMGEGSFSDIAFMEHWEIKGLNWGVAYQNYHSVRGYVYLEDTFHMLARFMEFYDQNGDTPLPHEPLVSSHFSRLSDSEAGPDCPVCGADMYLDGEEQVCDYAEEEWHTREGALALEMQD